MRSQTHLSRPVNLRDLGRHHTPFGVVNPGLVYRTDDLSVATPDFVDELASRDVTHVIDLRSAEEAAHTGRGPLAHRRIAYHHLPLTAGPTPPPPPGPRQPEEMSADYQGMLDHAAVEVATALSVIATARGAVAFHCSAGKDRTGIVAAMVLSALAVSRAAIIADYAKTEKVMPGVDRRMAPVHTAAGREPVVAHGLRAPARTMALFLRAVTGEPGAVPAALQRVGLEPATLRRLRRRLLS